MDGLATKASARARPRASLLHRNKRRMIAQRRVVFGVLGSHSCYADFSVFAENSGG
jgi:hypothetical protein